MAGLDDFVKTEKAKRKESGKKYFHRIIYDLGDGLPAFDAENLLELLKATCDGKLNTRSIYINEEKPLVSLAYFPGLKANAYILPVHK